MLILAIFAFLSGIITILSPCILPILPIVLSGSIGGRSKPFGVVTGFIASFTLFTLLLSSIVQLLNIPPERVRIFAVIIIISFGIVLVIPKVQLQFEIIISKFIKVKNKKQKSGFIGGFIVGTSLGIVWTPCVGPIMASVVSLAISQQVDGGAVIIILAYSLGTSIPMFGIMVGSRNLLNRFPKITNNTAKLQRIFGLVMITVGILIAVGLDRKFQAFILKTFPNYGSSITAIEDNKIIEDALIKRTKENE